MELTFVNDYQSLNRPDKREHECERMISMWDVEDSRIRRVMRLQNGSTFCNFERKRIKVSTANNLSIVASTYAFTKTTFI